MPATPRSLAKLAALAAAGALIGAACAPAENIPKFPVSQNARFLIQVPDSLNDAGRSPSVALDKDGNPVVSYLLTKAVLKAGEIPAPVVAGQPQPPAVMLTTESRGIWNRFSVTPQKTAPAQGDAPEIVDKDFHAVPGVDTGLAVDATGKQHVVWSTPSGLFYASGTGGSFAAPTQVSKSANLGGSVAVAPDGTPWVAFYEGGAVKVAHLAGGKWVSEDVTKIKGGYSLPATATAIRATTDGRPVVAFGQGSSTVVARRLATGWDVRALPGAGGLAVSLALDKATNPHVAYYDAAGNVYHAHSIAGAPWEVTKLGATAAPAFRGDPRWSTSIALDDKGIHYITWSDTRTNHVILASNPSGKFVSQPVPGSVSGANPALAVSPDGKKLALAWYDPVNSNLDVATSTGGAFVLAFSPQPGKAVVGPAATTCQPTSAAALKIDAPVGAAASGFDTKCLAVAAGKAFSVDFTNNDTGVVHNFVIYTKDPLTNPGASRLGGAQQNIPVTAGQSETFKVNPLKAGTYFYRCDFHPTVMTGTFVVK